MSTLVQRLTDLTISVRAKINAITPRLLPSGGTTGQVLAKSAVTDYATGWTSLPAVKSATVTIPFPGDMEWTQTVVDAGITAGMVLRAWLAETVDADENDPEMLDLISLTAKAGAGSVTFVLAFSAITEGAIKLRYKIE